MEIPIHIAINTSIHGHGRTDQQNSTEKRPSSSFLKRLHAGYFRICLSFSGQVLLWKTLNQHLREMHPVHAVFHNRTLPSAAFLLLWWLSFFTLLVLFFSYLLRIIFHFQLVKAEFLHHVEVNYFFAPWICWLLLIQSLPFEPSMDLPYTISWWFFVIPILILDVKTYGQWFTTEKRFLSLMANPASQFPVMGNFMGAWIGVSMGWRECGICMFALGLAHYLVVFITLYQRFSGADRFPVALRPVFFLFVATPTSASLAWCAISGSFDLACKMLFFLSLFLFTALISRPTLFKKSMKRFNISWWAYSFPLTLLALASAEYAQEVKGVVATGIMLALVALSVIVFLITTAATTITRRIPN